MSTVHLVLDSGCDLWHGPLSPHAPLHTLPITIVPLRVRVGDRDYAETTLPPDRFWQATAGSTRWPQTSQPAPGDFLTAFQRCPPGSPILCLTTGSRFSGTFGAASLAARLAGRDVRVCDSGLLGRGLGYLAVRAAEAAQSGATLAEIDALIHNLRRRTHVWIAVREVAPVRRGGRLDGILPVARFALRRLQLWPLLALGPDGMRWLGFARSQRQALARLEQSALRLAPWEGLTVVHTRAPDQGEALLVGLAEQGHFPRQRAWLAEAGPALATHAGSGAFALGVVADTS